MDRVKQIRDWIFARQAENMALANEYRVRYHEDAVEIFLSQLNSSDLVVVTMKSIPKGIRK